MVLVTTGTSSVTTLGTQTRRVVVATAGAEEAIMPVLHPATIAPLFITFPLTIALLPQPELTDEPQPLAARQAELTGVLQPHAEAAGAPQPHRPDFFAHPQTRDRLAKRPLPQPPPETTVVDMAALPQS